jgi:hypothetical protein
LPATVGGDTFPVVNIGDLKNSGEDISLSYTSHVSSNLSYSIGANMTAYQNKIVSIPAPGYFDTGATQILNPLVRNQEGHPISSFFGYDVIGLFQNKQDVISSPTQVGAAPGLFKYKDVNGDGQIGPSDRTFIGNPNPDLTYGITFKLAYRNFDLSANLYGSEGADLLNATRAFTDFFGSYSKSAKSKRLKNAWTPENRDTNIPKITNEVGLSSNTVLNSYFIENGSYLKMRSLMLGFQLPASLLQKLDINKLRIYVQAKNVFTISPYSGLDPEIGGSSAIFGVDNGTYAGNQRAYLFGINLSI